MLQENQNKEINEIKKLMHDMKTEFHKERIAGGKKSR